MITTTERARQIQAEYGCSWRDAVRRADRDLDGDGPPRDLINAANAWAEVLSARYPGQTFVGVVEPASSDPKPELRAA